MTEPIEMSSKMPVAIRNDLLRSRAAISRLETSQTLWAKVGAVCTGRVALLMR
ncbi:hypothetical protein [Cryobacterium sp. TMS1-13-1]|uniref:hypothetical protein n=1 Tax=Cryobacterium sp. TMS1-13-1 TaxID=1259220 RepID=UPI001F543535|nr:hypothetical protein [Cryobacterium sp. TMS1-13-1]